MVGPVLIESGVIESLLPAHNVLLPVLYIVAILQVTHFLGGIGVLTLFLEVATERDHLQSIGTRFSLGREREHNVMDCQKLPTCAYPVKRSSLCYRFPSEPTGNPVRHILGTEPKTLWMTPKTLLPVGSTTQSTQPSILCARSPDMATLVTLQNIEFLTLLSRPLASRYDCLAPFTRLRGVRTLFDKALTSITAQVPEPKSRESVLITHSDLWAGALDAQDRTL